MRSNARKDSTLTAEFQDPSSTLPPRGSAVRVAPLPTDWADCSVNDETRELVTRLNAAIEAAATQTFRAAPFHADYGVEHVLIVGSTSRGTYAMLPVDFDRAVLTERRQKDIPEVALQRVTDELVENISVAPVFAEYCDAIYSSERAALEIPSITLASLGLRGTESLVARYDLSFGSTVESSRSGFLDVTCGQLPHLIGYETNMCQLFDRLGPTTAKRVRQEIGLAKIVFGKAEGIYGSKERGLRGHGVEQLIIQSVEYRQSGETAGSFDNALRLILEKGTMARSGEVLKVRRFEDFKKDCPLWRPGGGDREGNPVNLWNLLGDGVEAAAEERWRRLVNVAIAYDICTSGDQPWSIENVVATMHARMTSNL